MGVKLDHGGDDLEEVHEINVTPFIDVILVLLIIFMIAAPLATVDVSVDLPSANAAPNRRPDKPLFLTLKSDLSLALDNDTIARPALSGSLDRELMALMNELRAAGYLHVALVGLDADKAVP